MKKIFSLILAVTLIGGGIAGASPALGFDNTSASGNIELLKGKPTVNHGADSDTTGSGEGSDGTNIGGHVGGVVSSLPLPWQQDWVDFFNDTPVTEYDNCWVTASWSRSDSGERWISTPKLSSSSVCTGVGVLDPKSPSFPSGTEGRTSGQTLGSINVDFSGLLDAVCTPTGSQLKAKGVEYSWRWEIVTRNLRIPFTKTGETYTPDWSKSNVDDSIRNRILSSNSQEQIRGGSINPVTYTVKGFPGLTEKLVVTFKPETCVYDYIFEAAQECIVGVTADISLNKNAKGVVSPARSVIDGGKVERKTSFGELVDRDLRDNNTFRNSAGTYFENEVLSSCLSSRSEKEDISASLDDYGIYSGTIDFTKRTLEYQKVHAINPNNGERKTLYFPAELDRASINNLISTWETATVSGMDTIASHTAQIAVSDEIREANPVAWSYHCDVNHGGATVVKFDNYTAANNAGFNYDATKCYNGTSEVTFLECTPSASVWTQNSEGVETTSAPNINIARDGAPIKISWNPEGKTSKTALTGGPISFKNSQGALLPVSPTIHWDEARSVITRTGTPWNANGINYTKSEDNNFRLTVNNRNSQQNIFVNMKNGSSATYDGDIMRDFSPNQRTKSLEVSADWSSDLDKPTVITPSVTYPVTLSGNFNTVTGIDISYEGGVTANVAKRPGTISTEVTCVGTPLTVNVLKANSAPSN